QELPDKPAAKPEPSEFKYTRKRIKLFEFDDTPTTKFDYEIKTTEFEYASEETRTTEFNDTNDDGAPKKIHQIQQHQPPIITHRRRKDISNSTTPTTTPATKEERLKIALSQCKEQKKNVT
ncbi:2823_t:CDS:2, partial [Gigaspora rosea]